MIYSCYLIGFIFYCLSVALSYSDKAKATNWYFPVGLAFAFICNYIWLYIAKNSLLKHDIYLRGLVWDSMIVGCYVLIPLIFYGVKFSGLTALGIAMIVIGMILTKI